MRRLMNREPAPAAYDPRSVRLHWGVALLIAFQWLGGRNIDIFPAGPLRIDWRSAHIAVGLAVLALIIWRLVWKLTRASRPEPAGPRAARVAALAVHWSLYALAFAVLILGVALEWVRGDSIFNLFKIPALDPSHKEWRRQAGDIHGLFANLVLSLACLHALAAVIHAAVWRDGVLGRMIPALRGRL
jgi:cytochrome b561